MVEPGRPPPGPEVPHRNPPGPGVVAGHRLGSGSAGLLHSSDYRQTRGSKDSSPLLLREQQRKSDMKRFEVAGGCRYKDEVPQRWPHPGLQFKWTLTIASWEEAWLFLSLRARAEGCGDSHCGQQNQAEGFPIGVTSTEAVPVASGRATGG